MWTFNMLNIWQSFETGISVVLASVYITDQYGVFVFMCVCVTSFHAEKFCCFSQTQHGPGVYIHAISVSPGEKMLQPHVWTVFFVVVVAAVVVVVCLFVCLHMLFVFFKV